MIPLGTRPYLGASDAACAPDSTARLPIVALALAFALSSSVLAEAQPTASIRQAPPTPSRETMTQLTAVNETVATPTSRDASSEEHIRPFRANVSDAAIADLRRRIAATRWPTKELVNDRSQGVQLATLKELTRYW